MAGIIWQWQRAEREAKLVRQQNVEVVRERSIAVIQRDRAEANSQRAREAVEQNQSPLPADHAGVLGRLPPRAALRGG